MALETTAIVEKGVHNLVYIQGLLFEKSKEQDKFRENKTCKSARKASKTWNESCIFTKVFQSFVTNRSYLEENFI